MQQETAANANHEGRGMGGELSHPPWLAAGLGEPGMSERRGLGRGQRQRPAAGRWDPAASLLPASASPRGREGRREGGAAVEGKKGGGRAGEGGSRSGKHPLLLRQDQCLWERGCSWSVKPKGNAEVGSCREGGRIFEDVFFFLKLWCHVRVIFVVHRSEYHYQDN